MKTHCRNQHLQLSYLHNKELRQFAQFCSNVIKYNRY